ncbi:hypothetical protein KIN20_011920 [Parelaphostrongylus tenuis]|uniref:Uncharacterized protein n=1 Tax=Parelaphostrongylus tenuis TaxID=148309 RepID=A0AAD5QK43_PARTN|nr:hypothetical protein KIN20_011920 [Parelaphostrongylus tenuis]
MDLKTASKQARMKRTQKEISETEEEGDELSLWIPWTRQQPHNKVKCMQIAKARRQSTPGIPVYIHDPNSGMKSNETIVNRNEQPDKELNERNNPYDAFVTPQAAKEREQEKIP